jgi:predicted esterase
MARVARLFSLAWLLVMLAPALLAVLLLFVAATWRGHLFAVAALGIVVTPVVALRFVVSRTRPWKLASLAALGGTSMSLLSLISAVPTPRSPSDSGAFSVFPGGTSRLALTTLLPEFDQLVLGSHLVAFTDPYLTFQSVARLRRLFVDVYRPMLEEPQFATLPTQLGEAFSLSSTGQRFVYVPDHAAGERLPCVVFLHGSGGNFQGYLWVWRSLADAGRFVVVAPGFGFGDWHRPGGVEAMEVARREAIATLPVDPSSFVLAGLSNGGRGVMRAIENDDAHVWKAVVLLSAVVDVDPSEAKWRDRPVLLVHGLKDDRISEKWFRLAEASFTQIGAKLTSKADPDEDHFLIFSRRDELAEWVLAFLRSQPGFDPEHGNRETDR